MSDRRCSFILPGGRPCAATPQRDAELCVFHDPGRADEVAEGRRLGGLRRRRERTIVGAYELGSLSEVEGLRRLLEIAALDVIGLDTSIARNRVLVAIVEAGVRLLGAREFEERLMALEIAGRAAARSRSAAGTVEDSGEPRLPADEP